MCAETLTLPGEFGGGGDDVGIMSMMMMPPQEYTCMVCATMYGRVTTLRADMTFRGRLEKVLMIMLMIILVICLICYFLIGRRGRLMW